MRLSGILNGRCHEEAVNEVAGGIAGAHGLESLEIGDKVGTVGYGEPPELPVLNDVEAEVPCFGAIFVQTFAVHDLQAVRHEILFVVIHRLEFHEHALFDRVDKFPRRLAREILFFEKVGNREGAARLQESGGRSKEPWDVLIVGDRFDGPENVELFLKVHGLGVHQEELCIESFGFRGLYCHLDLYRGNSYASDAGVIVFGQVKTASAEAAADVKNISAGLYVCGLSEMVDKLKLRFFLGFIPSNPVSVMDMLAPEGAVVGTHDVIVLDDSVFFVWARHCG